MDFIFYSLGTTGDALPFIKLCSALNSLGRKTVYLCNEKFLPLANFYGVEAQSVSSEKDYDRTYTNPLTWSSIYNHNHYNEFHLLAVKSTYKAIEAYVQSGSKPVVVFQDVNSGARMACIEFGLTFCQVVLAPSSIVSIVDPVYPTRKYVSEELWAEKLPSLRECGRKASFERLVVPLINPQRRELGLLDWTMDHVPQFEDSPNMLALFPNWFKPPPADWPAQLVNSGFILGDSAIGSKHDCLDAFIESYGRPVVFSFGTGVPTNRFLIEKLKKVCAAIGRPGVLVGHSNDEVLFRDGSSPLLISRALNFSSLFSQAAMVVHHGGIGTCAQALSAGIPQLVSPYTFDQPDNAYLLWRLGVGNSIDIILSSVDEIVARMEELLSDRSVAKQCAICASKTVDALGDSINYLLSLIPDESDINDC